jgi:hypothetical protein
MSYTRADICAEKTALRFHQWQWWRRPLRISIPPTMIGSGPHPATDAVVPTDPRQQAKTRTAPPAVPYLYPRHSLSTMSKESNPSDSPMSTASTLPHEHHENPPRLSTSLSHRSDVLSVHRLKAESYRRSAEIEDARPGLYPVTSYASQIGGEGDLGMPEEVDETEEKDPNLVEWDGPDDPANPYNW